MLWKSTRGTRQAGKLIVVPSSAPDLIAKTHERPPSMPPQSRFGLDDSELRQPANHRRKSRAAGPHCAAAEEGSFVAVLLMPAQAQVLVFLSEKYLVESARVLASDHLASRQLQ